MIRKFYTSSNIEPFAVQNGFIGSNSVTVRPTTIDESCLCYAQDCERNMNVLADLNSPADRKNDKTSFLFKLFSSSDTIDIKLFKDDIEIAALNSSTYGTFFNIGDLASGVPEQDFYAGYLLEWQQVLALHGTGFYKIKADFTQFGTPVNFESERFYLLNYTDSQAEGSVKLVTYQNGNIESSEFNFTGMNWYQQVRFNGILWNKQSELISDTYLTSSRSITQIQDSIKHTYTLQIEFLQDSISKFIIDNNVLANEIFVSDYNLTNTTYYNEVPLVVEEITESTELYYYNGRSHELLLTDRVQNIRKRNYN